MFTSETPGPPVKERTRRFFECSACAKKCMVEVSVTNDEELPTECLYDKYGEVFWKEYIPTIHLEEVRTLLRYVLPYSRIIQDGSFNEEDDEFRHYQKAKIELMRFCGLK